MAGLAGFDTTTSLGFVSFASPQITVTLFFFSSMVTPPLSRPETPRERCTTAAASKQMLSAERP